MKYKNEIKESMTKDNCLWAKRPIPVNQLKYAAEDVKYLIKAYAILKLRMNKNLIEIVNLVSNYRFTF